MIQKKSRRQELRDRLCDPKSNLFPADEDAMECGNREAQKLQDAIDRLDLATLKRPAVNEHCEQRRPKRPRVKGCQAVNDRLIRRRTRRSA